MARLWMTGFGLNSATSDVEVTTFSGTVSVQSTVTRIGPYALRTNPGGAALGFARQVIHSTDQSTRAFFRAYLRVDTLPSVNVTIMRIADSVNDPGAQLRMTTTGTLLLLDSAGTQVGSASSALSTGTWYRLELELDASSSPGSVAGRLDGTTFASGSNAVQKPWSRVLVGPVANCTFDGYWTDLALNDTSGSQQTSWPDSGVVLTLLPNAAGDANGWNNTSNGAGDSNNYTLVDERPPDDATTLVQTGTLNTEDLYNVAASGMDVDATVNCVMVGARFRNNTADATTAFKLEIEKTSGGTISQSAAIVPNSTTWRTNAPSQPRNYPIILHNDPDGSAWTPSTVDSMQIGVKLTTANVNRIQVSTLWALVDYTPNNNASAEAATGTGAANTATTNVSPSAGNAAGTGAANDATVTTSGGGGTSAPAEAATGAGTANAATSKVSPGSPAAAGTGAALDATTTITTAAQAASGTGTANDATAATAVVGTALAASGAGAAGNATTLVSPSVQSAAATGTANSPSAAVGTSAQAATGTGAALNATAAVAVVGQAEAATGSGTANAASTKVSSGAGAAAGSGAAHDTTTKTAPAASAAAATGTANDPSAAVSTPTQSADGTGAANNATVLTGTVVSPAAATGTGAAHAPTLSVALGAEAATSTGTAANPTAQIASAAGSGSGTGTATAPAGSVTASAQAASATGAALDAAAVTSVAAQAQAAAGAGAAHAATGSVQAAAGVGSGTGAGLEPVARVSPSAQAAAGTGAALNATVTTSTGGQALAQSASGSGAAYDPTVTVTSGSAVPAANGWAGLLAILRGAAEEVRAELASPPSACPDDGEPLVEGPDGRLFCRFDGWRPDGSYVSADAEYSLSSRDASLDLSLTIEDDPWF